MVREKEVPIQNSTPKPTFIRLQLAAGEAISAPPLSATLGQVQINSSEFCKTFNAASTQLYEVGVLLNVDLFKNPDNTYYFYIKGISLPYILFQTASANKLIPVEALYDVFKIKLFSMNKEINFGTVKLLFGAIRGMKFKVIL
jgi:ribosomal protein L11